MAKVLVDEQGRPGKLKPRGAGFAPGLFVGFLIVAGALGYYAYSQGSFQNAGHQADVAAEQVESQARATTAAAGDAIENAGDQVEAATDQPEQRLAQREVPVPENTAQN